MAAEQATATSAATSHDRATLGEPSLEQRTREVIRAIWAEVLGVPAEKVGDQDDFFAQLAGSSLQVLSIMERIQALAGAEELPQDIFFGEQTVKRQASILLANGRRLG